MDKLLSINEAAALINVHPETLRRWDNEKTFVAIKVNDRGDRRYKESDILEFINTNPQLIKYNQVILHGGYTIKWYIGGFVSMPANFGLIAQLTAHNNKSSFVGFAFAVAGMSLFARTGQKDDLDKLALDKIKKYIDEKTLSGEDVFTFEFENGRFREVQNPEWWQGKYSKSLVTGLRVKAHATHPTTVENKAWRVILHFESEQDDRWLPNTFGAKNAFHEYFVWIDSKELVRLGLPNTPKGAEILAVDFGIKRFEETKDKNGDRDVTRINENNAACFGGKCTKDSLLPDELLN
ncbi:MAG: binding domain protein, excisionase family protein [Candidatus Curtissbacteria bacterium GW2011_GWA1_41_11]|uniref:Binding domain protein, excisionase family protein n=1 Tax=Candidatus Curtissbacteria bacterium GW2011_GWA1_41_11 TaxID=1618409 RepID=A0A0G0WRA1_9BACT|nr:MAG: binding domain protein, excisionase family protein [Candidatus Curtissbacteria bacterium GW2011_GWA1_41_11]